VKAERQRRFRQLADEVTPAVAAYVARRQYPLAKADLDDIVAEVLLVLWRRLDDVPVDGAIPWSIGVARNVRRNAVRKSTNAAITAAKLHSSGTTASAEDAVIGDEGVKSALLALSDDDREIIMLHFWDGLSAGAIATVLGVSENAAAVRLSRAQERFRRHIETVEVS
jgi:RNA polymerase sigma-70 factor (ECF subfamily)